MKSTMQAEDEKQVFNLEWPNSPVAKHITILFLVQLSYLVLIPQAYDDKSNLH